MSLHPFRQGAPGRLCMEGKGETTATSTSAVRPVRASCCFCFWGKARRLPRGDRFFSVKGDTCSFFLGSVPPLKSGRVGLFFSL